jgi:hypothetical protein
LLSGQVLKEDEMATESERNERKFAEPRSWAGKWCGYGLEEKSTESQAVERKEGRFSRPRGWAANWCGRGLFNGREK